MRLTLLAGLLTAVISLPGAATSASANDGGVAALAGSWVAEAWGDALEQTHSPLAAVEAGPPIAFVVERAPFGWRLTVTNFHEGVHFRLAAVEGGGAGATAQTLVLDPAEDDRPDPAGRRRVKVTGLAGGSRLRAALWSEEEGEVTFRRVEGSLAAWASRATIAGEYRDLQGRPWSFAQEGQARWPERRFDYEVVLDTMEADCDYLQSPDPREVGGEWRTGFAWHGGKLELRRVAYDRDTPISCEEQPFAVLTPMGAKPSETASAACGLHRLDLAPRDAGSQAWYVSAGRAVRLEHRSFHEERNPDRFTDGPLQIVRADGTRCALDVDNYRSDLYLSRDEKTAAVVSFSGSMEWVRFVDVASCRVRDELTVGEELALAGDTIRDRGFCEMRDARAGTCLPASVWHLDPACRPVRDAALSAAATRERFGVAFDQPSEIERPGSREARRLGPAKP